MPIATLVAMLRSHGRGVGVAAAARRACALGVNREDSLAVAIVLVAALYFLRFNIYSWPFVLAGNRDGAR